MRADGSAHDRRRGDGARQIYEEFRQEICARTDRMFVWALLIEWAAAILAAGSASPRAILPMELWRAALLGGGSVCLPIYAAINHPGQKPTRRAVAIGQALISCVLLDLSGGRPEMHFAVFGAMAFLAMYRDAEILIITTAMLAAEYIVGGLFWPQAVYGVPVVARSAWLQYVPWMLIEDLLLILAISKSRQDLIGTARRQVVVENSRAALAREVTDRQRTERLLSIQYVITRLLATSSSLVEATPLLLGIVGKSHGWHLGELWEVDESGRHLRCVDIWKATDHVARAGFLEARRARTFAPEEGLAGRVWNRHLPLWVADMADPGFPLGAFKDADELRGAFAVPLRNGPNVIGVMAFYSREICEPNDDHLSMVSALGGQIGQFMDRKRIDQGLRVAHAELESNVEKRTWQLREINQKLQEEVEERERVQAELRRAKELADSANQAKSAFLANMSHELRTPLNAVIGFSELLEQELFGPLTDKQRSYVGNVLISGRHLLQLVNDILDISKVEAGRMDLACEWTPLGSIVDVVKTVIQTLANKKGINLEVAMPPFLPELYIDPGRMKQVLYNLVTNGIKFTPRGGTVRLSACLEGDHVRIEVADTGVGIAPEHFSRLFREFEQIPQAGGLLPEGTGLGLALTRRLVTLHGGEVQVESKVGKGSIFSVKLPLVARAAAAQAEVETEASTGAST
jgi:signal transduction histidine kinase